MSIALYCLPADQARIVPFTALREEIKSISTFRQTRPRQDAMAVAPDKVGGVARIIDDAQVDSVASRSDHARTKAADIGVAAVAGFSPAMQKDETGSIGVEELVVYVEGKFVIVGEPVSARPTGDGTNWYERF